MGEYHGSGCVCLPYIPEERPHLSKLFCSYSLLFWIKTAEHLSLRYLSCKDLHRKQSHKLSRFEYMQGCTPRRNHQWTQQLLVYRPLHLHVHPRRL